jgi:amino acid permease
MHVTGFDWSVSVSIINWSVSVSIFCFFVLVYCHIDFRYDYDNDRFQVSSYRYVSLSVSKVRSLERGGLSELSQAQVD